MLSFVLLISIAPLTLRAAAPELTIYLFWSASSSYSTSARAFLYGLKVEQPDLQLKEFEVDASLANAALLGQVYARAGLSGITAVPLIVIGQHLIVGYIDDEHSGRHVAEIIAECRKARCPDSMRSIIDGAGTFDGVSLHYLSTP